MAALDLPRRAAWERPLLRAEQEVLQLRIVVLQTLQWCLQQCHWAQQ
jgi:hypothetical protein